MALSEPSPTAYEALIQFLYRAPIGLVQTTRQGEITLINPMAAQWLMPLAPAGDLDNLFKLLAPMAPQLHALAAGPAEAGAVLCEGLRLVLPAAGPRAAPGLVLALNLLRLDDESLMASLSDITLAVQQEQQRLSRQLRHANRTDSLTALPNRAVVIERIAGALQQAQADPAYQFAVLFINGDRFNRINVTRGQAAGDALLRLMAARINGTVRQRDAVGLFGPARPDDAAAHAPPPAQTNARLGGDEFVVVLEGLRQADDALAVAQRLAETLSEPYAIGEAPVHSPVSIGIVLREHANGDADAVLQDASLAMRQAKQLGGARCCVFDPAMKTRAQHRASVESELRQAIDQGQLFVVYQPLVHLPGGSGPACGAVAGVEALVRWRHPQRGIVPPIEFIEIAEATGLIGPIGEFVLQQTCRQGRAWQRCLGPLAPPLLSVNLSRAQLAGPGISAQVQQALQASGLSPACLQLEVTESLAAQDQQVQARLHELKALGLSLALDDFGTGYSSLASLHQLPVDVVKIDRSFVCQAEQSAHHRVLIEATVRVARSLGMRTVAEGVETPGQAAVLNALQCDKGQGYLWARPMPADEATRWLAAHRPSPTPGGPVPAPAPYTFNI